MSLSTPLWHGVMERTWILMFKVLSFATSPLVKHLFRGGDSWVTHWRVVTILPGGTCKDRKGLSGENDSLSKPSVSSWWAIGHDPGEAGSTFRGYKAKGLTNLRNQARKWCAQTLDTFLICYIICKRPAKRGLCTKTPTWKQLIFLGRISKTDDPIPRSYFKRML